jgi:membrane-associated phospholipid phosphatase
MKALTDFGDLAVLLPLSAVMLLWLLAMRSRRSATWWLLAAGVCMGGTAILKIYFHACPVGKDLSSPSGHTSLSTLVYGAMAAIVVVEASALWQRSLAVAVAVILIVGIAGSRFALDAHSILEIVIGMAIGLAAFTAFVWGYLHHRPSAASLSPLLFAAILILALFLGREVQAEQLLHAISRYLRAQSLPCP